ncbi:MAG: 3-isopropylmalate dehydratase small subunit [Pyrinomonadaceae bacterium]
MRKFTQHAGKTVPLYRANIDTDQIVPKNFLLRITRTGFADALFYEWRFDTNGNEIKEFALNNSIFSGATILIGGKNFGCGSSREHAPWALDDFGFRVIIAPSFADIFYNNCFKIGLLPIALETEIVEQFVNASELGDYELSIDLASQTITDNTENAFKFEINEFKKYCLINGLDEIGLTLVHEHEISKFEDKGNIIESAT